MIHVFFEQSGMIFDGTADDPWHRDCDLGLHRTICPLMKGSFFLGAANRETGELRFLPGSWRTAGWSFDDPEHVGVGLEAGPGDVALHYGDGIHADPSPISETGPFRSSIVIEYGPPGRQPDEGQEQNDLRMHDVDAARIPHGPADPAFDRIELRENRRPHRR